MDRVVTISRSFAEADAQTRLQYWAMSPIERMVLARALLLAVYGPDCPDVRAAGREWQGVRPRAREPK